MAYNLSLEEFRHVCQKITAFYFVERYPFVVDSGLTESDVRESLEQVGGMVKRIRAELAGE